MKEMLNSARFILHLSSFIGFTPSLTVGLLPLGYD